MSDARIKFRCFQCNRLLGVSPSKAGTVVACPKCSAELLVPDQGESGSEASGGEIDPASVFRNLLSTHPDAPAQPPAPPEPPRPDPSRRPPPFSGLVTPPTMEVMAPTFSGLAESPSADPPNPFSFLQTEQSPTPQAEPTPRRARAAEPAPSPPPTTESHFPTLQTEEPARRATPARPSKPRPAPAAPVPAPPPSPPPRVEAPAPAVAPAPGPPPADEPAFPMLRVEPQPLRDDPPPLIPPVRVEPPPTIAQREPSPRRNDVVLPRTAIILWSFLVLLALVLSFTTGLLAGHFLWTTSTPAAVKAPTDAPTAPDRAS